jgi:hypothetical protein
MPFDGDSYCSLGDLSTLVEKLERCKERFGIPLVRDFGPAIYVYV